MELFYKASFRHDLSLLQTWLTDNFSFILDNLEKIKEQAKLATTSQDLQLQSFISKVDVCSNLLSRNNNKTKLRSFDTLAKNSLIKYYKLNHEFEPSQSMNKESEIYQIIPKGFEQIKGKKFKSYCVDSLHSIYECKQDKDTSQKIQKYCEDFFCFIYKYK